MNVNAPFNAENVAGAIGAVIRDEWGHFVVAAN